MSKRIGMRELLARGTEVVKRDAHWSDEQREELVQGPRAARHDGWLVP